MEWQVQVEGKVSIPINIRHTTYPPDLPHGQFFTEGVEKTKKILVNGNKHENNGNNRSKVVLK